MNETQQAIFDAMTVLRRSVDRVEISYEQFLKVCRADPAYALNIIKNNRFHMTIQGGTTGSQVASMILSVEWELQGTTQFLAEHADDAMGRYIPIVEQQLQNNPQDFSRANLHTILDTLQFFRLHDLATKRLGEHVTSFADRLTATPISLSKDIESLKKSINNYGFGNELNEALRKIDDELKTATGCFRSGKHNSAHSWFLRGIAYEHLPRIAK